MEELSAALDESLKEADPKPAQQITQTVHKDMSPGPLAQDDTLQPRKESREMIPARLQSTRDLAVNALDDLQTRSAGSNFQEQVAAYRDSQKHADHTSPKPVSAASFNAGRTKGNGGLAAIMRIMPLLIITVLLLGTMVVFGMTSKQLGGILHTGAGPEPDGAKADDPDKLYRAGKYAQALAIWRSVKAKGSLSRSSDKYLLIAIRGRQPTAMTKNIQMPRRC